MTKGTNDSASPCGRAPGGGGGRARLLAYARTMRGQPTRAERVLWHSLRACQLEGLRFRRQAPLGPFIADFFCPSIRLVVEVDGVTHTDPDLDRERDKWMQSQGIRVLRFWGEEVVTNLEGVLQVILAAAGEPLPPAPSRKGRGSFLALLKDRNPFHSAAATAAVPPNRARSRSKVR